MKEHIGNLKQTRGATTTVLKFRAVRSPITLRSIRGQGAPEKMVEPNRAYFLPVEQPAVKNIIISEVGSQPELETLLGYFVHLYLIFTVGVKKCEI